MPVGSPTRLVCVWGGGGLLGEGDLTLWTRCRPSPHREHVADLTVGPRKEFGRVLLMMASTIKNMANIISRV